MKKILSTLLALVMIASLVACGNKETQPNDKPSNTDAPTATSAPTKEPEATDIPKVTDAPEGPDTPDNPEVTGAQEDLIEGIWVSEDDAYDNMFVFYAPGRNIHFSYEYEQEDYSFWSRMREGSYHFDSNDASSVVYETSNNIRIVLDGETLYITEYADGEKTELESTSVTYHKVACHYDETLHYFVEDDAEPVEKPDTNEIPEALLAGMWKSDYGVMTFYMPDEGMHSGMYNSGAKGQSSDGRDYIYWSTEYDGTYYFSKYDDNAVIFETSGYMRFVLEEDILSVLYYEDYTKTQLSDMVDVYIRAKSHYCEVRHDYVSETYDID